jgi:peptide/nickel transport system permease protein
MAVFAAQLAPYPYDDLVGKSMAGPSTAHWFGTDRLGRDQLSRVIYGARVSMVVGFGSVVVGGAIATMIGLVSGMAHRVVDLLIQRVVDTFMSFPWLVILLFFVSVFGTSTTNVILLLGLLQGISGSRIARSAVLSVKGLDYILAARVLGCSTPRIMVQHVLPNIAPTLIVMTTVNVGFAILAEAALSFLGFGVPPPIPSWGRMLSTDLSYMVIDPWLAFWPGLALTLAVFSFNVLGDGLRDALDPRLRGVG